MATQVQLAVRRDAAYQRMADAVATLAADADLESPLAIRHRDPQVEQIMRLEQVADTLETIAAANAKSRKATSSTKAKTK